MTRNMLYHGNLDDLLTTYHRWQTWSDKQWAHAHDIDEDNVQTDIVAPAERRLLADAKVYFGVGDDALAFEKLDQLYFPWVGSLRES